MRNGKSRLYQISTPDLSPERKGSLGKNRPRMDAEFHGEERVQGTRDLSSNNLSRDRFGHRNSHIFFLSTFMISIFECPSNVNRARCRFPAAGQAGSTVLVYTFFRSVIAFQRLHPSSHKTIPDSTVGGLIENHQTPRSG